MSDQSEAVAAQSPSVVVLDDHVAIARPDGSVSLYVHNARRLLTRQAIEQLGGRTLPSGSRVLAWRILHADGSITEVDRRTGQAGEQADSLVAGDTLDEEYVVHYSGDGGIPEHPEAFQFVFGSFNEPVLNSRFVALTPAGSADRGVVISTGAPPPVVSRVRNGMLQRIWETNPAGSGNGDAAFGKARAIVRVVEQENGWTVPSNAEHHRRIETIHPGPRLEDS
jgi:hypothetical protein